MKLRNLILSAAAVFVTVCATAKDAHFAWNPSSDAASDPTITYNLFVYTNSTVTSNDVFTVVHTSGTNAVVTNLVAGQRYWANVTAVDTNNLSSDPSNTASFIFPGAPTFIHLVP